MIEKGACKICSCYGHEEVTCYEVIQYPPNWDTHGHGGWNNRGGWGGA